MDNDYILRIILRAKDEMGTTIARARAELQAFTNEGDRLERRAETLNRRLDTLNRRMDTFVRRGDAIKQTLGVAGVAAEEFERRVGDSVAAQREEEQQTRRTSAALAQYAETQRQIAEIQAEIARGERDLLETQERVRRAREEARAAIQAENSALEEEINKRVAAEGALQRQAIAEEELQRSIGRRRGAREAVNRTEAAADAADEQRSSRRRARRRQEAPAITTDEEMLARQAELVAGIQDETEATQANTAATQANTAARRQNVELSRKVLPPAGRREMQETRGQTRRREIKEAADEIYNRSALVAPQNATANQLYAELARLRGAISEIRQEADKSRRSKKQQAIDAQVLHRLESDVRTATGLIAELGKAAKGSKKEQDNATKAATKLADANEQAASSTSEYTKAQQEFIIKLDKQGIVLDVEQLKASGRARVRVADRQDVKIQRQFDVDKAGKVVPNSELIIRHQQVAAQLVETSREAVEATEDHTDALERDSSAISDHADAVAKDDVKLLSDEELFDLTDDDDDSPRLPSIGGGAPGAGQDENAAERTYKRFKAVVDEVRASAERLRHSFDFLQREEKQGRITTDEFIERIEVLGNAMRRLAQRTTLITSGYPEGVDEVIRLREESASILSQASSRRETQALTRETSDLDEATRQTTEAYNEFVNRVQEGGVEIAEQRALFRQFATDLDRASRSQRRAGREWVSFAVAADRARSRVEELNREIRRSARETEDLASKQSGLIGWLERTTDRFNRQSESVAALDNKLRGMVVLAVLTFAQQLITLMTSLAAVLASVASSAAAAGGALAGALAAGAVQAFAPIGLLIASLARLKGILDVQQQSQLVQEQLFQRQNDVAKKAADATDTAANAQDGLTSALDAVKDANERTADAAENLRKVRREARNELLDLIQAERDAELAARGAAINQDEAQRRLRLAVAGGDVDDIASAELGVLESEQEVATSSERLRRAREERRRVGGNIENLESVRQAKKALAEAKEAADETAKGVDKANRSLQRAGRNSATALDDSFSAAEKLVYMLGQLSGAELKLFVALERVRRAWQENFRPITDILVAEFADTVNEITRLLQDDRIVDTARGLAIRMAQMLETIRNDFTGYDSINQIVRIQRQGFENFEPLTRIVQALGHAFLNIAEAAGPSLTRILEYLAELSERIQSVTSNMLGMNRFFSTGTDHLLAWFDLARSVFRLLFDFATIAAPEGLRTIQGATEWIDGLRERMNAHSEEIVQIIQEGREALGLLLGVLGEVFLAIIRAFDVDSIRPLAQFIREAVIPALELAIIAVGRLSQLIFKLIDAVPGGTEAAGILIFLALIGKVANATRNLFGGFLGEALTFARGISGALTGVGLVLAGLLTRMSRFASAVPRLAGALAAAAALLSGRRPGRGSGAAGGAAAGAGFIDFVGVGTGGRNDDNSPRRRGGIISGLFGRRSDIADDASNVGKAAGTGFKIGFGTILAGGLFAISAISAIATAFRHDSVIAGLRDIGSTLTGGIIDSAAEVAARNADKITDAIQESLERDVSINDTAPVRRERPNRRGRFSRIPGDNNDDFDRSRTDEWIESLEKRLQKPARRAIELAESIRKIGDSKDLSGILRIQEEVRTLAGRFPELKNSFDPIARSAERAAERIRRAFEPIDIAKDFGNKLQLDPKHWRGIVDDAVKELGKLPPEMRDKGRKSVLAMVAGLRREKELTREQAKDIKERIVEQVEDMRKKATRRTQRMVGDIVKQYSAWTTTTSIAMGWIGEAVNDSLRALGVGVIKAFTRPRAAGRAGQLLGFLAGGGDAGGRIYDPYRDGPFVAQPGMRGADDRYRRVAPGEAVLTAPWQRVINYMLPGQHTIQSVVKNVRGMHGGTIDDAKGTGDATGRIVGIPWQPGEEVAASLLGLLTRLRRRFRFAVTDAFDRDRSAGHRSPGHNVTGTAVDAVPGPGGNWGLIESLGRWAVARGMTVGYGAGVPGSQPWPNHGRGNHIHIEFGSSTRAMFQNIGNIRTPRIGGPDGALRDIANAALRRVTRGANRFLDRQMASTSQDGPYGFDMNTASTGQVRQWLTRALRITGHFSPANLSALIGRAMQESGGNPRAVNNWDSNARLPGSHGFPNQASRGLLQTIPDTFFSYALPGMRDIFNPIHNAVAAIRYMFARYGRIVGRSSTGYMFGGPIPGYGGGDRHPVLVEGGEHVITKEEVKAAGGHEFFYKLRRMLGGGKQGGPTGYQEGGSVRAGEERINMRFSTAYERARLAAIRRGLYDLPQLPLRDWEDLTREARRVFRAIRNSGRSYKARLAQIAEEINRLQRGGVTDSERETIGNLRSEARNIRTPRGRRAFRRSARIDSLNQLVTEGGILDQMDTQRQRMTDAAARGVTRLRIKFDRIGGKIRNVMLRGGNQDEAQAERAVRNARKELDALTGQRGIINEALEKVRKRLRRLRRGGVSADEASEFRQLETLRTNLRGRLDDIANQEINAIDALMQAKLDQQQTAVDAINTRFERAGTTLDRLASVAERFGDSAAIERINQQRQQLLRDQIGALSAQLGAATALGNTELATQLADQMADLNHQIFEIAQDNISNLQEAINSRASRDLGRLDLFGRMAEALGIRGQNTGVRVGGQTLSRQGVFAARQDRLEQQRAELQQLLNRTQSDPATAGNTEAIQALTDQILELDVTIAENTKAAFNARVEDVNARTSYSLGVNDLLRQIAELQGELSGNTNSMDLLRFATQRQQILTQQRAELEGLLNDAIRAGDQEAVETLTEQMLQNQLALLQNTKAMNELNGTITGPQQFSSSAWEMFRTAIFNGLGGLLPQYEIPQAHTGGVVSRSGLIDVEVGEIIRTREQVRDAENHMAELDRQAMRSAVESLNIHYHEVNESPSPMETALRAEWMLRHSTTLK